MLLLVNVNIRHTGSNCVRLGRKGKQVEGGGPGDFGINEPWEGCVYAFREELLVKLYLVKIKPIVWFGTALRRAYLCRNTACMEGGCG